MLDEMPFGAFVEIEGRSQIDIMKLADELKSGYKTRHTGKLSGSF